jgi:ATP-dependent helicase/DNAse subunit B
MSSHRLYTSPYLAALEKALLSAVQKEKADDPLRPVVILVGSHLLGRYLVRMLARESGGLVNVRFVTIMQLASILGRDHLEAERGLRPFPGELEGALLGSVLHGRDFTYLNPVKEFSGFRAALRATLRDLRDAGLVESFILELAKPGKPGVRQKWRELAAASEFFASYRHGFYDDADLLQAAGRQAGTYRSRFNAGRLFIYGIYDFTATQAHVVKALAGEVTLEVFIPHGPGKAYGYANRGLDWFEKELGVKKERLGQGAAVWGELAGVQQALAEGKPPDKGSKAFQGSVEIIAAPGELKEIEEIAGKIIELAGQGVPFSDMGVLTRSQDRHLPLIEEVFGRAGIPYFSQEEHLLTPSPLGKFVTHLLELLPEGGNKDFYRPTMISLISCGCLSFPEEDDEWTSDQWRKYSIDAGIVSGWKDWDEKLRQLAESNDDPEERARIERFREYVLRLIEKLTGFPGKGSFKDFAMAFNEIVREFTDKDIETWVSVLAILDELGVSATRDKFKETIGAWAQSMKLSDENDINRFQEGAVTVGGIMGLRGVRFKAVFAPGLVGRSFPAPVREDPILLDDERAALAKRLGKKGALRLNRDRPSEDRLLFSLLVQAARERLALTYARTDEHGKKEKLPSPFLLEVASALAGEPVDYSKMARGAPGIRRVPLSRIRSSEVKPEVLDDRPALDNAEFLLWDSARRGFQPPPPSALKAHPFLKRGLEVFKERSRPLSGPFTGRMKNRESLEFLSDYVREKSFSPSALEAYARCPFAFFAKRVMRLESPARPEDESFDNLAQGNLIHAALRSFMEEVRDRRLYPLGERDPDDILPMLKGFFDAECKRLETDKAFTRTLEWALEKERLLMQLPAVLDSLIKAEKEGFMPAEFEFSFGFGEESRGAVYSRPDPVPLALPSGITITLWGHIDRFDVSETGSKAVRSIDYKTGNYLFKGKQRLRSGTALQSGVYLIASGAIVGAPLDDFSDSGYVHVLGASAGKSMLIPGDHEFVKRVKAAIDVIVQGIKKGVFSPLPAQVVETLCDWCDCGEVCGPGGPSLCERLKDKDPAGKVRESLDGFE